MAEADFLLREVADRMHERLAYIRLVPKRILDVGCGTGRDAALLRAKFPQAQWFGVDMALNMLRQAKRAYQDDSLANRLLRRWRSPGRWIQADMGMLPVQSGGVDLLWSNLVLHWSSVPHLIFPEWQRVLADQGLLMFSLFGPDTLMELRAAIDVAGEGSPMRPFVDMHDIGDMLVHSGLANPVIDMEKIQVTYETPEALLADVRRMGAYPGGDARAGCRGRAWRNRLCAALQAQRNGNGNIVLTFEVVYGHAWKVMKSATEVSHATIRLDEIGGRVRRSGSM